MDTAQKNPEITPEELGGYTDWNASDVYHFFPHRGGVSYAKLSTPLSVILQCSARLDQLDWIVKRLILGTVKGPNILQGHAEQDRPPLPALRAAVEKLGFLRPGQHPYAMRLDHHGDKPWTRADRSKILALVNELEKEE